MEELTRELRAVREMLGRIERRLDEADKRANRHSVFSALLALALLVSVSLGGFFLVDAAHENERICGAVRGSAEALIAVTERPSDGEPRTKEEQKRRDQLVAEYRSLIAKGCPG